MSYRPTPTKEKIAKRLNAVRDSFTASERMYILESLHMQDKLLTAISSFLASCRECRGGAFCHRCDLLIRLRDTALGKHLIRTNAPKKSKAEMMVQALTDDDDGGAPEYEFPEASEAVS